MNPSITSMALLAVVIAAISIWWIQQTLKEGRKALDSKLDDLSGQGRFTVTVDKELEDFGTAVGPLAKFATLNFIEKNETGFKYTLTLKNETVVSEVARLIVEAGFGLSELSKEKRDLETIFNEI